MSEATASAQVIGEASRLEGWSKKAEIDGKDKGRPGPLWQGILRTAIFPEIYIQNCVCILIISFEDNRIGYEKSPMVSNSLLESIAGEY